MLRNGWKHPRIVQRIVSKEEAVDVVVYECEKDVKSIKVVTNEIMEQQIHVILNGGKSFHYFVHL